ncbi:hypothetical protein KKH82_03005 [Patescibacteria group bacterium]|nr:hypothetical protein [Patescibacteria group bacterium]
MERKALMIWIKMSWKKAWNVSLYHIFLSSFEKDGDHKVVEDLNFPNPIVKKSML